MPYRNCEDCGTRLISDGTCPMCDEELLIFEQEPDFDFSEEFMDDVRRESRQREKRIHP